MELRPYQEDCLAAHWDFLSKSDGHPLFVVPTAGGKSHIIAEFLRRALEAWPDTRAIVITHVKELIGQNFDKFVAHTGTCANVGIYSAGLGYRDTRDPVIFAGIQSIYQRAEELGRRDLVLIDECHLVPKEGQGRYLTYLTALREINPNVRILGYTATPYRIQGGWLHKGEGAIFTDIAYEITIERLLDEGFLSPLVAKQPRDGIIDTEGVATVNGDFDIGDLEQAAEKSNVSAACDEMVRLGADRAMWLCFCVGVAHAEHVAEELNKRGVSTRTVFGHTREDERDATIEDFKAGRFKCLVNFGVLTTGFDAPRVDLLALMRPTQSTSLYVQIAGRGMRVAEGKKDCLLLDFGLNVARHGPVNRVQIKQPSDREGEAAAPTKVCPECDAIVFASLGECPYCEHVWTKVCPTCNVKVPIKLVQCNVCGHLFRMITPAASDLKPIVRPWDSVRTTHNVLNVYYSRHRKKDKPDSLRVDYLCAPGNGSYVPTYISEWVCCDHEGFAGTKAFKWWIARADADHETSFGTDWALARTDRLPIPVQITTVPDGKFTRIVGYTWVLDDPTAGPRDPRARFQGEPEPRMTTMIGEEVDECPF